MLNTIDFIDIYKLGTFYNPAYKHYAGDANINNLNNNNNNNNSKIAIENIICDRCNKDNLLSCIGYQNFDLCLQCILEIETNMNTSTQINYASAFSMTILKNKDQTFEEKEKNILINSEEEKEQDNEKELLVTNIKRCLNEYIIPRRIKK